MVPLVLLSSCRGTESLAPANPVEQPALASVPDPVAQRASTAEEESIGEWHTGTSSAGGFEVSWRVIDSKEITVNEHFELELRLIRLEGRSRVPWENAQLEVRARMPEHRHGMLTRPVPIEVGAGVYRIPAMLFHMEGYWVLHVSVRTGAGVEDVQRATFDLDIR